MAKHPRSFRLEDKDMELIDLLVDKFTYLHGIDHNKTTVLTMAIRKLAWENLSEEEVKAVLDK